VGGNLNRRGGIGGVMGCSIKGNVKENTFPSTGSEEELRDFQRCIFFPWLS
jgi:hypothetical protein